MNPLKERKTGATTKAITTLFTSGALIVVGFLGMISMPQIIGSVYAQDGEQGQGAEHACKDLPGATLVRGECRLEATPGEPTCEPSQLTTGQNDVDFKLSASGSTCVATGPAADVKQAECEGIVVNGVHGVFGNAGPGQKKCTIPATPGEATCPNDIVPNEEGVCITKPGDRTEE